MHNYKNNEKPPITITQIPSHISAKLYKAGLEDITGARGYISKKAYTILKKYGLSNALSPGSTQKVSKEEFMRAVKILEQAGLIKHKLGRASDIYTMLGSQESWQKFRLKNIKKRKKEYITERHQKDIESVFTKHRLIQASGDTTSVQHGRAVKFGNLNRAQSFLREREAAKHDKKLLLKRLRERKDTKRGWQHKQSDMGWQQGTGGSGWSRKGPQRWTKNTK